VAKTQFNLIEQYSMIVYHYGLKLEEIRKLNIPEIYIYIFPLTKRLCESLGLPYGKKQDENEEENQSDEEYPTSFSTMDFAPKTNANPKMYSPTIKDGKPSVNDFVGWASQFGNVTDNRN